MDLTPDTEQQALVAATAEWCRAKMPLEEARSRPASLWPMLEEMGWTGMTAPAMGLGHATEALVFAELGRHLAPVGLIASAVASRWSPEGGAGDGGGGGRGGDGRAALALIGKAGDARFFDPEGAGVAIAIIEDGTAGLAPLPGGLAAAPGLDLSAPMARMEATPAFTPLEDPRAALHLQLLAAAFSLGVAEAARDMAAAYAGVREQFGRPIGWFQALKHLCADMAVRCAVARAQLLYAACTLDADEHGAAFHIAAARDLAGHAALENGRVNIQVHGGIGMTDEAYPHLCLKRAHLLSFIAPARRDILLGDIA